MAAPHRRREARLERLLVDDINRHIVSMLGTPLVVAMGDPTPPVWPFVPMEPPVMVTVDTAALGFIDEVKARSWALALARRHVQR